MSLQRIFLYSLFKEPETVVNIKCCVSNGRMHAVAYLIIAHATVPIRIVEYFRFAGSIYVEASKPNSYSIRFGLIMLAYPTFYLITVIICTSILNK